MISIKVGHPLITRKNDAKLMVGYMKRYDTGVAKAKEAHERFVENGKILYSRSHVLCGNWLCGASPYETIRTGEEYPKIEPKFPDFLPKEHHRIMDSLLEVYVHNINLPRYFLGDPEYIEIFKHWRGKIVCLVSYRDFPLILELGHMSADFWEEQLVTYFADGWVDLRTPPPLLRNVPAKTHVYHAGKTQVDTFPHSTWTWSFQNQAQHFVDCIIEDKEPNSNGADSYRDIVIIESMLKSLMKDRRQIIEY